MGVLRNNTCFCQAGWTGKMCNHQLRKCPERCSKHGACVAGICVCDDGWEGFDCMSQVCVQGCKAPHGQCFNGTCYCKPGMGGVDCSKPLCPSNCSGHGLCLQGNC